MPKPLNIVIASSEAAPFAKTGGLADVCGALPRELAQLGHHVSVFLPAYRSALECGQPIEPTEIRFSVPIGAKTVDGQLLRSTLPGGDVPVYLVDQPEYYDRNQLYREDGRDYKDNCERFVFFSRAVIQSLVAMGEPVHILHVNDWQTGLIPAFLEIESPNETVFADTASVMTLHNLAYQGQFWHWDMLLTGLDWKYFNWHQMEFHGHLNLLKTGIVFADSITTVSPQYGLEIQADQGCGLEAVLRHRGEHLRGILNGVSYDTWNPELDEHLAVRYSVADWRKGKAACKAALQSEMGLPVLPDVPLIGLVGRLAEQKGWDLVSNVIQRWVHSRSAQWVILGSGDTEYQKLLTALSADYPAKVAAKFEFSEPLAHRIEAGADMFVMPSRYEPCGLNQMYSLKYGTIPVVRRTGGLADTISNASDENLAAGVANGFSFGAYDPDELAEALGRACTAFENESVWSQLVETGMGQDWSWGESARQYVELYFDTLARKKQAAPA